jgi:hypothetical protein
VPLDEDKVLYLSSEHSTVSIKCRRLAEEVHLVRN